MLLINQNYLEALEVILTWDIPDDAIPRAVADQAQLMAGFHCEQLYMDDRLQ
jgi:hypothetical protein